MSVIQVTKCDHHGRALLTYEGRLLARGTDWLCLRALFQHADVDLGCMTLRRGDLLHEWFYRARWHNVFRVADGPGGALKGWYCNITRPAVIRGGAVSADDLELDLCVTPAGATLLLDEVEFAAAQLSARECRAAWRSVAQLRVAVATRQPPFCELPRGKGACR